MSDEKEEIGDSQEEAKIPAELQEKNTEQVAEETTPKAPLSDREAIYEQIKKDADVEDPNRQIERDLMSITDEETPSDTKSEETPDAEAKTDDADKETKDENSDEELSETERIKQKMEKRINKEVGKRKTLEERLEEAEKEVARLKEERENPKEEKEDSKNSEPTEQQVRQYMVKMREEGNVEEEMAALDYLFKIREEAAIKRVQEEQNKQQMSVQEENTKYQKLVQDYTVYDDNDNIVMNDDLNLANQDSKLFKTAMSLYQDTALKERYSDSDKITGFRLAVSDAHQQLVQLERAGKIKLNSNKESTKITKEAKPRDIASQLASPDADGASDEQPPKKSGNLSDVEKVKQEMIERAKFKNSRSRVSV